MQENILSIDSLQKRYQKNVALNSISLQIPKGSVYGLIGQNGAGKTTLIRILNKIIDIDSGTIHFNGQPIRQEDVQKIGYLPEERGLYKNMTIEEQAMYFGQLKGMTKKESKLQLDYWLNRFDISDWKKKKIQDLSKGMAQKVQFIITVLHQPELLILDEPFSGFDPINANLIASEIKQLAKNGTTVIFSSHRMESVAEMCDHVCLIHQGTILLDGTITDIQKKHAQAVFEINLFEYNDAALELFLTNTEYTVAIKHQDDENVQLEVLPNQDVSDNLLTEVLKIGSLHLYKQYIPSLQEIFIKTIENA
ncbi:ABC transporter ATP-binding protein [Wenyingzhuangia sp. 2_MG-2023]|uniref:ABC transporter ATP-binding protein n=1 Tax=Wenyingzhuangia sp. 2_MG-2023 TaxID=3062639 RepID=UPI0026E2931C|nr:ATP-binding cassette domain-containing protein [Wenyingzhuangia sp. 2_MG-2023]MDO6737477.1 ATP-binding cassette domain-containing protein [Wenyingzhuangia sp. 2_MG-2023]